MRRVLVFLKLLKFFGLYLAVRGGYRVEAFVAECLSPAVDPGAQEDERAEEEYGEDGDGDGEDVLHGAFGTAKAVPLTIRLRYTRGGVG